MLDWFRCIDTLEAFFFRDTLDPVLGKLTFELFRLNFRLVGLPTGVEDDDLFWCFVCSNPSLISPGPSLDNLCKPLPCDGILAWGWRLCPTPCALCNFVEEPLCAFSSGPPLGEPLERDGVDELRLAISGRRAGEGEP